MIKIYTTPHCAYCHKAMDFMKSRGVDYEVIDLMENKDAQKFIFTKVGQYAVPIIEVGDKFMVGYNQVELEKLINSLQK